MFLLTCPDVGAQGQSRVLLLAAGCKELNCSAPSTESQAVASWSSCKNPQPWRAGAKQDGARARAVPSFFFWEAAQGILTHCLVRTGEDPKMLVAQKCPRVPETPEILVAQPWINMALSSWGRKV